MSGLVSLVIVEDDEMIREALRLLVERMPLVQVVGEAADGRAALMMIDELRPAIVLTDVVMPFVDGIVLTRTVRQRYADTAVVILTGHNDEIYLSSALKAGAAAYLLKGSGVDELPLAIRAASRHETYVTPKMARQLVAEHFVPTYKRDQRGLTLRQRETLHLIAKGKTNKEIAEYLHITVKTVEKHRTHLMQRLDLHGTAALVNYARDYYLIP